MLAYHHIASAANPELQAYLQKANEERAAAIYAPWRATTRAIAATVHSFVEPIRRARRARATYRELSVLSDHQLQDIGLTRDEVASVAEAVATGALASGQTVAELRKSEHRFAHSAESHVTAVVDEDRRPRRPHTSAVRPRAARAGQSDKAAA